MTKREQNKIIKQIQQLCEKQYRKGFQQGFHTCQDGTMTEKQVDSFRHDGMYQDYKKVIRPHNNCKEDPNERLQSELGFKDTLELANFLKSE